MVHWYHGNSGARSNRRPNRKAAAQGPQGAGRVSRLVPRRPSGRHLPARIRGKGSLRPRVAKEDRRPEEDLRPHPHREGLAQAGREEAMTDDELLAGFEGCALESFHHADHVRVVWIILHRFTTSL